MFRILAATGYRAEVRVKKAAAKAAQDNASGRRKPNLSLITDDAVFKRLPTPLLRSPPKWEWVGTP
jgi:hypothetical protein